jgi:hypothetical protein
MYHTSLEAEIDCGAQKDLCIAYRFPPFPAVVLVLSLLLG